MIPGQLPLRRQQKTHAATLVGRQQKTHAKSNNGGDYGFLPKGGNSDIERFTVRSTWEAEELRIALEATRTVEDLDIEGRALAEQLQHIEEYAATPAETLSPWP
jgi:hypothetical protein